MKKKQRAKERGKKVGGTCVRRRWADPPPREGRLHLGLSPHWTVFLRTGSFPIFSRLPCAAPCPR